MRRIQLWRCRCSAKSSPRTGRRTLVIGTGYIHTSQTGETSLQTPLRRSGRSKPAVASRPSRYVAVEEGQRWNNIHTDCDHPALAIYTFNPRAAGWSRPRGAPRTRWSDVLRNDLKQLGITLMEASNIALDRSRWRSTIVARAVSTPSWQET